MNIGINKGFSTVELLITMFIGAVFLIAGYQLYAVILKNGGETRMQLKAYNAADDYLQRYKSAVGSPNCVASTPINDAATAIDGLSNPILNIAITCPYGVNPVSKITVTLKYNANPQQTVMSSSYATP